MTMLLATPLHPPSFSTQHVPEDSSHYKPSQDFKSLLAPIEFIEGSSSGALAVPEGRYEPINGTPKASTANETENVKSSNITPVKPAASAVASPAPSPNGKAAPLYAGVLDTTWPQDYKVGAGLYNTGNTCFLNSALQCLLHTPPLLRVLSAHGRSDPCRVKKNIFCMACNLRDVMMTSHARRNPFIPTPITSKLYLIAKHMRRGRQEDSHEFLRYAIDALQKSCLAGYPLKIDGKLAETTWVHRIFGGRLRSRVTCRECYHNSDTFDSMLDLSLDILRQNSLKEALHSFVKVETLNGADKYKCEKCKKPVVAHKQFTIHKAPLVLTVHLKRFSPTGRKMPHHIKYDERISLQPVMSEGQHGPLYSLYGVICHAGSGPNSGHYYGHIKGANGQWFEMNDDSVIPTRAPIGVKSAYILFYIREKGQALEAAVSRVQIPPRNGIAAGMKKRKVTDGDDEGHEDTGVKTARPFIGPQLPSSTPDVAVSATQCPAPNVIDPQADSLKKKIAAAPKATQALQSLSQYVDEDSDKEDSVQNDNSSPANDPPPSTPPCPPTSTPVTPLSISTSSFYHSSNGKTNKGKKRKSPDGEVDENKHSYPNSWARKPLSSPHLTTSSPRFHPRNLFRKSSTSGGNPYNRLRGSNNLYQKDSGSYRQSIVTYKKKRRI